MASRMAASFSAMACYRGARASTARASNSRTFSNASVMSDSFGGDRVKDVARGEAIRRSWDGHELQEALPGRDLLHHEVLGLGTADPYRGVVTVAGVDEDEAAVEDVEAVPDALLLQSIRVGELLAALPDGATVHERGGTPVIRLERDRRAGGGARPEGPPG